MGIPSYFITLLKNNSNILNKFSSKFTANGLYFDSNSIIYDVIKELENRIEDPITNELIYKNVCEKLVLYINIVNPRNEIYISLDGVSPSAKIEQQRQRRYKTQVVRNIKNQINPSERTYFDTNQITPGTEFMDNLCLYITEYFKMRDILNNKHINIILNLSTSPGEGEHKIYNYIRQNHHVLKTKYNTYKYNHLIYGLDSDLIMLSLINYDIVSDIYLLREAPHFINKINNKYVPGILYYIDFNIIKSIITHGIHQDDYVLVSFIIGNDFIPHNPAFTLRNDGLAVIIDTYKKTFSKNIGKRNITHIYNNRRTIDHVNLKKLFIELSNIESVNFKENLERKLNFSNKIQRTSINDMTLDDKINFIPKSNVDKEYSIFKHCSNEINKKKIYYKVCFGNDYNNITPILENYLEALYWNFDYYTQNNIDVFWKYNYNHAPFLSDVVCSMTDFEPTNCFSINTCINISKNPIHPQTQLSYVLPKESHRFLNKNVKKYIDETRPELTHHCLNYDYAFSSYLWEGHLELNYIDIKQLNDDIIKII